MNSRIAPVYLSGVRTPCRNRRADGSARTDRNAFMIERIEQCTHADSSTVGKQCTLRSRDGEDFDLPISQQHTERAQVIGDTVGIDDRMKTRLARMCVALWNPDNQKCGGDYRLYKVV